VAQFPFYNSETLVSIHGKFWLGHCFAVKIEEKGITHTWNKKNKTHFSNVRRQLCTIECEYGQGRCQLGQVGPESKSMETSGA
jgi:uncharacterized protein YgiB involved in biofilm formation